MKEPSLINISEKVIKKQRRILIIATILVITLFIGSSYSLLTSHDETEEVITVSTGKLNMKIEIDKGINLGEELPKSDEEGFSNQEVKITLENTGTIDIGRYEVKLMNDTSKVSTLDEKYIKYSVSEEDNKRYQVSDTLENDKNIIYTGYNLKVDSNKIIYLKLWLDSESGEEILNKNYYGSINVELYQEDKHENNLVEEVKSKLVSNYSGSKEDFSGGLIAVNQTGDLYKENNNEEIREYRYSGLNVNNYVTFNNELWRIIGVFKDENNIEHVKIVRNEQLNGVFPEKYLINNKEYTLSENSAFYWFSDIKDTLSNDWTISGLQYYLNTEQDTSIVPNYGYMHYLNSDAKKMIQEMEYYLGNGSPDDIVTILYNNEHDEKNINSGNKYKWLGKIALMYGSDLGYASNSKYWSTFSLANYTKLDINNSNWLFDINCNSASWLLDPVNTTEGVLRWLFSNDPQYLLDRGVDIAGTWGPAKVIPSLYLKSDVKITRGDGTSSNSYQLSL